MEKKDDTGSGSTGSGTGSPSPKRYSDWSPVLESTLETLSKIYPILARSVFEFLAYESVSSCVHSLVEIARKISSKLTSVHAHLYLIKHLLILREQISPFEVDFSIEETTLDFKHMANYLLELVNVKTDSSHARHYQYSLVEVLKNTIPTISKHHKNSKKTMEYVLKRACEAFIQTQTNLLIGHVITFISKYKEATDMIESTETTENKDPNDSNSYVYTHCFQYIYYLTNK